MFTFVRNTIKNTLTRRMVLLTAAAAGVATLVPMTAQAHEHDHLGIEIHIGGDRSARRWVPPVCEERGVQVWVEPVYRTVCDEVYERPVFRTVVERVWREPEYRTTCERVWVPDRYEIREVTRYDCGRPAIYRERVLVCPAHYEKIERRVVVCEGRYETIERQVPVSEGHYRHIERQELVTPGHYETRTERVEVVPGHWETGYASSGWDLRIRD